MAKAPSFDSISTVQRYTSYCKSNPGPEGTTTVSWYVSNHIFTVITDNNFFVNKIQAKISLRNLQSVIDLIMLEIWSLRVFPVVYIRVRVPKCFAMYIFAIFRTVCKWRLRMYWLKLNFVWLDILHREDINEQYTFVNKKNRQKILYKRTADSLDGLKFFL